jgi:predicted SAM-dependent methyltransferase
MKYFASRTLWRRVQPANVMSPLNPDQKAVVNRFLPRWAVELIRCVRRKKHADRIAAKNANTVRILLQNAEPIKLELGAGGRSMEGWTGVDRDGSGALNLDLTQRLPFPKSSVDMIYSSHVLEHFTFTELVDLLNECKRVLKSGGIFSACVPNARIYLEAYHSPAQFDPNVFCQYRPAYTFNSKIDFVNYIAYMAGEHRYMFDEENIVAVLKRVGFAEVKQRQFDKMLDLQTRDYESIYVEARK